MTTPRFMLLAALAASVAACGGGTGGTGFTTSPGGTNAVSIGVMTKGSVIVNGVEFADSTAQITIDNTPKTPADLQSGMVVKVRGQINNDRLTGTAEVVQVEIEARGTVTTHNSSTLPPSFTVVGQTVFVDDQTILANFGSATTPSAAVAALVDGTSFVEVHGLRDGSGNILASRVELSTSSALDDELRGTVASLVGQTFTLQNGTTGIAVDFTGATITPASATVANNDIVEVHGAFDGTTFHAALVNVEDDAQFQPGAGEDFSIEGQVSNCASPCTSFSVGGRTVQTTPSTQFVNGTAADLANNITVEAEGNEFSGDVLVADKIEFEQTRVILTGQVTAVTGTIVAGTGNMGTVTVLGQAVQINTLTNVSANAGITTADRVEVRGFLDGNGSVVAQSVNDNPSGKPGRDLIQAPVSAENEAQNAVTLLGIVADLTNATFDGTTHDQFFAALNPNGGTLVKLTGTFAAGAPSTMAVDEAELED